MTRRRHHSHIPGVGSGEALWELAARLWLEVIHAGPEPIRPQSWLRTHSPERGFGRVVILSPVHQNRGIWRVPDSAGMVCVQVGRYHEPHIIGAQADCPHARPGLIVRPHGDAGLKDPAQMSERGHLRDSVMIPRVDNDVTNRMFDDQCEYREARATLRERA